MRDPVVPRVKALYGHSDAGGNWEAHCEKHLREVGFEPVFNWPSVFHHKAWNLVLMVNVNDSKMSEPSEHMAQTWKARSLKEPLTQRAAHSKPLTRKPLTPKRLAMPLATPLPMRPLAMSLTVLL